MAGGTVVVNGKTYMYALGAYFDPQSQEMFLEGDTFDTLVPTGYTFERVFQKLDTEMVELFPMAFATKETGEKVVKKLQEFWPGLELYVAESDADLSTFPTMRPDGSLVQQLFLTSPKIPQKHNVGLIANTLMRNCDSAAKMRLGEEFGF